MLETCAPELINTITSCPSTMMGASSDHPTRQAIRSRFKNRTVGVTSHRPVCQAALILVSPGLGFGWECGAYCHLGWLLLVGVSCIPLVPPWLV